MTSKIFENSALGITEDNISDILASNCLNSTFKQSLAKGNLTLSRYLPVNQKPQCVLQGKDYADMTDDEKKEFEAYKVSQKIRQTYPYLPKAKIQAIEAIEQQTTRKYNELCLGKNIITQAQFDVFEKFLEKQEEKKKRIIDEIYNDWDNIIKNFIEDIKVKYPYIDENLIIDVATKKIGTADDWKKTYKVINEYVALPSSLSASYISDATKAQTAKENANKQAERELIEAIGENLNVLFQAFNKIVLSNYNISQMGGTGTVAPKTKGTLNNSISIAKANLSFLRIPELDNLLSNLDLVSKKDDKALVTESENALYDIYDFMKDFNLQDYLRLEDSVVPEASLEFSYNQGRNIIAPVVTINTDESSDSNEETLVDEDVEVYW
jgi:hypothetical protein